MKWREVSIRYVKAAMREADALGLEGKAFEQHVSRHGYPFGERAMWPYKVWLEVFKKYVKNERVRKAVLDGFRPEQPELFPDREARPARDARQPLPGQGELFE